MSGKVVLVPFPFDDLSGTKLRPAVCLTDPIGIHRHVILAFITSNTAAATETSDLRLGISHPDFARTGLKVDSALRLHRLMTVNTTLIQRVLGELSPNLQTLVESRLKQLFKIR